jgi:hypothetical protein
MSLTTHLSLVSSDRNALLDVIEDAEAAFLEYGLAPDIGGVRDLNSSEAASARTVLSDGDGGYPDHFSPELVAELREFGADRVHHAAVRGLPVIERVVREEVSGRPSVVVQANVQSGSGPGYRVYRYDRVADAYEVVAASDR